MGLSSIFIKLFVFRIRHGLEDYLVFSNKIFSLTDSHNVIFFIMRTVLRRIMIHVHEASARKTKDEETIALFRVPVIESRLASTRSTT